MSRITLHFQGEDKDLVNPHFLSFNQLFIPYPCATSYSCSPYLIDFPPGSYQVKLYGASGGNTTLEQGGKGGFTQGNFIFKKSLNFTFLLAEQE